jgi:phosphoribosylanthranilate isomerase
VTRVKVCGITRLEDAELAIGLGAWALGFILWPGSPRAADPATAAGIAARVRRKVETVGVFVDPTLDEVAQAAEGLGLSMVQLHGAVGPSFCQEVGRRTGLKVIRAFKVGSGADVQSADRFRIGIDYHLFDTQVIGGTGQTWDWSLTTQRRSRLPLILSGGLTPENVAEGIANTWPYAVDTASGTESAPGVKDEARLRAFFAAVSPPAPEPEAAQEAEAEAAPAEAAP